MNEPAPFTRRADGVYIGDDKVAHIVDPGGHVRMAAGKGDLRDEVLAFLDGKPLVTEPPAESTPPASQDPQGAGDAAGPAADAADVFGTGDTPPVATPAPVVTSPPPAAPVDVPRPSPSPRPSAPAQPGEKPKKPIADPFKGDKDPVVIDWYRKHDPDGFARKYAGTRWANSFPE